MDRAGAGPDSGPEWPTPPVTPVISQILGLGQPNKAAQALDKHIGRQEEARNVNSAETDPDRNIVLGNNKEVVTTTQMATTTIITPNARRSKPRVSRSARAGLAFPVSRVERRLKASPRLRGQRVSPTAAVYLTAVLEYVVHEALLVAGEEAAKDKRKRILPSHFKRGLGDDAEFDRLLFNQTERTGPRAKETMIPGGGVSPGIIVERRLGSSKKSTKVCLPK